MFLVEFRKTGAQIMVELQNFEVFIILQKCPQEIGFVPGPALFDPSQRIFKWPVNVMKVNNDAGLEGGQNFEENAIDITTDFCDM